MWDMLDDRAERGVCVCVREGGVAVYKDFLGVRRVSERRRG